MDRGKTKLTCYECGSSYSLDLSRISAKTKYIKCLKCSKPIPILTRLIKGKPTGSASQKEEPPAEPPKQPEQTPATLSSASFLWNTDSYDDEDSGGEDGWLATYGDMMSILLIFFVLLFSISSIDKKKYEIVAQSVSTALGGSPAVVRNNPPASTELPAAGGSAGALHDLQESVLEEKNLLSVLRAQFEQFIVQNGLSDKIALFDEDKGLVLTVTDVLMFDSGKAEIRPEVLPYLNRMGAILGNIDNEIVVEGHTDDTPISTDRFSSNWELSVMRATNVIHFFMDRCGIEASRLSAAGYAYYQPRYEPSSADRAKNRRIEVVVRRKYDEEVADQVLSIPQD